MCSGMLMACFLFLFSETRLVEIMDNLCSETEVSSLIVRVAEWNLKRRLSPCHAAVPCHGGAVRGGGRAVVVQALRAAEGHIAPQLLVRRTSPLRFILMQQDSCEVSHWSSVMLQLCPFSACCPAGKWGPTCLECPGRIAESLVCSGNGECNVSDTRNVLFYFVLFLLQFMFYAQFHRYMYFRCHSLEFFLH